MAFLSKVGNILRQTAGKQINNEISASRPSLFQAVRFMSSSKIFVGGVSYQTDDTSLREAFSKYGEVIEARIIVDRETGRSRGFGFVTYTSSDEASSAIQALDGQDLHGRRIRVNYANDRPRGNFGGGFGGGGYGAGGGGYGAGGGGYGSGGGGYGAGGGYGSNYGGPGGNYGGGDNVSYDNRNNFDNSSTTPFSGNWNYSSGGSNVASGNPSESSGNYGVAGGGSDNLGSSFGGNDGLGQASGGDEFGDREDNLDVAGGGYDQDRDEDDTGDFAKRA